MKNLTKREPICYGSPVVTRNSAQEWYESSSRDARRRAKQLRDLGYKVVCSSMGPQVGSDGTVVMTLLTVIAAPAGQEICDYPRPKVICRASTTEWSFG